MAYAFDQINSALGQQAAGQDGSGANIFGQENGADSSQQGQSAQGSAGSGEAPKTSTEGELSAGSAGSSGATTQPKQTSVQTSGQAILDKAKQANIDTGFTNKIVGDVKQGEANLQNEADAYTKAQAAKAPNYASTDDAEAGISGNKDKFSAVENLLRGPGQQADQFQSGVSGQFQDIDQIGTQGGLQSYLKKRGDENYSEGDAALDSLLFSRDKNFQQGVTAAKQERDNLNKQKQDYEATLQDKAQQQLDASQGDAKAKATAYLNAQKSGYENAIAGKVSAENARRQQIEANSGSQAAADAARVADALKGTLGKDANYLDAARKAVDPNLYAHHGYTAATNADIVNADSANQAEGQRFNSILNLLGQGGQPLQIGAANPYQGYSYDNSAYQNALMNEIAKLRQPPATVSASGGVPISSGGFNPIQGVQDIGNIAKDNPLETLATGGANIPIRAAEKSAPVQKAESKIKKVFGK